MCATALAAGDACDPLDDRCGASLECRENVCKGDYVVGEDCKAEGTCGFFRGFACVEGSCVAMTGVPPDGSACETDLFNAVRYCVDQLTGNNNCIDEDSDGVGICVVGAGLGDACAQTGCIRDASCENDVCVEQAGIGDACPGGFECKSSLKCVDEVCAELLNLVCTE
jgi:hypothetical protein